MTVGVDIIPVGRIVLIYLERDIPQCTVELPCLGIGVLEKRNTQLKCNLPEWRVEKKVLEHKR